MKTWLEALDAILRGEATRLSQLKLGLEKLPVRGLTILIAMMGATYGICMGCFAIFNHENPQFFQIIASMIKVPALYLCTLLVTLPSLYVFNALVGSRLRFMTVIRLLVASLAVTLAVLASFGPIVGFFSLTTTSYPFMKLLNVAVFGLSGVLGLGFLLQTMHRLTIQSDLDDLGAQPPGEGMPSVNQKKTPFEAFPGPEEPTKKTGDPVSDDPAKRAQAEEGLLKSAVEEIIAAKGGRVDQPWSKENPPIPIPSTEPKPSVSGPPASGTSSDSRKISPIQDPKGALDFIPSTTLSQNVQSVFACWVVLFGLVGAQMSWVLRPFIGAPDRDFTWFRPRESNFFDAVYRALFDLFR